MRDPRWDPPAPVRRRRRGGGPRLSRAGRALVRGWIERSGDGELAPELVAALCHDQGEAVRDYVAELAPPAFEAWARRRVVVAEGGGPESDRAIREIVDVGRDEGLYRPGMARVALRALYRTFEQPEHVWHRATMVLVRASDLEEVLPALERHARLERLSSMGLAILATRREDLGAVLAALPRRLAARAVHAILHRGADPVAAGASVVGWSETCAFAMALGLVVEPGFRPRAADALARMVESGVGGELGTALGAALAGDVEEETTLPRLEAVLERNGPAMATIARALGDRALGRRGSRAHQALERGLRSQHWDVRCVSAECLARIFVHDRNVRAVRDLLRSDDRATWAGAVVATALARDLRGRAGRDLRRLFHQACREAEENEQPARGLDFWNLVPRSQPRPSAGRPRLRLVQ